MGEEEINSLREKVDALKTLSLTNTIHKLQPPNQIQDQRGTIEIVEALKADPIIREVQLELRGMMYDEFSKTWMQYRDPVMNALGIGNFLQTIKTIAKTIEYSNFSEKDIPRFAFWNFRQNYPYFTIYHKEYELKRNDFNLIATILLNFIISSFNKAKGAGHRNVVRGTYSEDVLGRVIRGGEGDINKKQGFFSKLASLNPLSRGRRNTI